MALYSYKAVDARGKISRQALEELVRLSEAGR